MAERSNILHLWIQNSINIANVNKQIESRNYRQRQTNVIQNEYRDLIKPNSDSISMHEIKNIYMEM